MKLILSLFVATILSSCASYIKSFHNQIDKAENTNKPLGPRYNQYNNRYLSRDARPVQNPVTLGDPSAATRNHYPQTHRQYNDHPNQRYKASDLLDNDPSGSLWNGKHGDNFLFVTNNVKKEGDIVIVEVKKSLKKEITDELDRSFPAVKKKGDKDDEKEDEEGTTAANTVKLNESPDKVYDKIPTKVVERINNDYLLIKGRKEVLFRKYKRYIQFQAIVSSKTISDNDTVTSDKIIEPHVTVMRY